MSSEAPPETIDGSPVITPHSLVTQDLVEAALRADKGPDAQLGLWHIKDFTKAGDNYACVVSCVVVDYTEHGKEYQVTYIVKLNPCRNLPSMGELENQLFQKEGQFYRDIVPELNRCLQRIGKDPLALPRLVHVVLEPKREVIFLEDMRPHGFKMFDRKKSQDSAHAFLVIKELAKLHSASVMLQKRDPGTPLIEKYPILEDMWTCPKSLKSRQMQAMMANNLKGARLIAELTPGYEDILHWIDDLSPRFLHTLRDQVTPTSPSFAVINHGDCWINNILFRYDAEGHPVETVLLDLQVSRICDLGCDLNYYLYSSFDSEDRTANLENYLDTYYNYFKEVLDAANVEISFTRSELTRNYEVHNLLGIIIGLSAVPIILADSIDVMDLSKLTDDTFEETLEEFGQMSIKTTKKHSLVKSRFLCLFDDLIGQGFDDLIGQGKIPSK